MKYKGKDYNMWDVWYLNDRGTVHGFHLKSHPGKWNVGHVITKDLIHFEKCEDILHPLPEDKYPDDCMGKFTGCAFTHPKTGKHYIYYTMRNRYESEKIGVTLSDDLENFKLYENNPVLTPDPEIFYINPKADGKTDCRDMLVVYIEEEDIFYGYFAAMAPVEGRGLVGVVGVAESKDLLKWENQSIAFVPEFNGVIEMPEVFYMEGKWYLTMLAGNSYGSKGVVKDSSIVSCTLYAVADNPKGPFVMQEDNIFIGGPTESGYSCRSIEYGGKRYVCYVDRSEYGWAISLPKEIKVIDGRLCPCYTPILQKLRTGRVEEKLTKESLEAKRNTFVWETYSDNAEFGDDCVKINAGKYSYQYYVSKNEGFSSVEMTADITPNCDEAGFVAEISEGENNFCLGFYINTADGEFTVYDMGGVSRSFVQNWYNVHSKRKFPFERGKKYFLRIILQEGQYEVYIDDVLLLQAGIKTGDNIKAGFGCGCGEALFENVKIYELEK